MKPRRALHLIILSGVLAVAGAKGAGAQTVDELYREGVAARMEQRFEEAVSLLDRAKTLAPDNADVLVQLGFAQLALANNAAAREAFEQALAIVPSYEDARFGLAQIAFRSSDLAEARRLAAAAVGAQPNHAEAKQLLTSIEAAEKADQVEPPPAARAGPTSQPAKRAKPAGDHASASTETARGRPLCRGRDVISRGPGAVARQCRRPGRARIGRGISAGFRRG